MACLLHKMGNTMTDPRTVARRAADKAARQAAQKEAVSSGVVVNDDETRDRSAEFAAKRAASASRIEALLNRVHNEPKPVKPYQGLPVVKSSSEHMDFRVDRIKEMLAEEEEKLVVHRSSSVGMGRRSVTFESLAKKQDVTQGGSNEFLPFQQIKTIGKPTLCRPMPEAYSRMAPYLDKDSLFTSENRGEFWWKSNPARQQIEIKQNVRPLDAKYAYRENVLKMAAALRHPPVRSL